MRATLMPTGGRSPGSRSLRSSSGTRLRTSARANGGSAAAPGSTRSLLVTGRKPNSIVRPSASARSPGIGKSGVIASDRRASCGPGRRASSRRVAAPWRPLTRAWRSVASGSQSPPSSRAAAGAVCQPSGVSPSTSHACSTRLIGGVVRRSGNRARPRAGSGCARTLSRRRTTRPASRILAGSSRGRPGIRQRASSSTRLKLRWIGCSRTKSPRASGRTRAAPSRSRPGPCASSASRWATKSGRARRRIQGSASAARSAAAGLARPKVGPSSAAGWATICFPPPVCRRSTRPSW